MSDALDMFYHIVAALAGIGIGLSVFVAAFLSAYAVGSWVMDKLNA